MKPEANLLITDNKAVKDVFKIAEKVASSGVNILLTGESGTGKNMLSRTIHTAGDKKHGPFISVNCLAIPETLIESELFGHEKGAFTDACTLKRGSFEVAHRGTLYLDEIGDMTFSAQGKILQAIEEKHFRRVGGEKLIESDARIISATNQELTERVKDGKFREDLYYRLKEIALHLPPLRDRKEDIPLLLKHYVEQFSETYEKPHLSLSKTALSYLTRYTWPGNIRELKNVVKSAVILCSRDMLWLEDFPFEISLKTGFQTTADHTPDISIDNIIRDHIVRILEKLNWNKMNTAKSLGISRPRLDRYLKKFGIQ
jgi:DNA-binding NtrC family response regulator